MTLFTPSLLAAPSSPAPPTVTQFLTIDLDSQALLPYQGLSIAFHIKGLGKVKRIVHQGAGIYISQEGTKRYRDFSHPIEIVSPTIQAAGQMSSLDAVARFALDNRGNHIFPSPGKYKIQGYVAGLISKEFEIEVLAPAGPDAAAYETLQSGLPLYRFFERPVVPNVLGKMRKKQREAFKEGIEVELMAFIRKYPTSAYARHAEAGLVFWRIGEQDILRESNQTTKEIKQLNPEFRTSMTEAFDSLYGEGSFVRAEQYNDETREKVILDALKQLEKVAAANSGDLSVRYWIEAGKIAASLGNTRESARFYDEAKKLKPSEVELKELELLKEGAPSEVPEPNQLQH